MSAISATPRMFRVCSKCGEKRGSVPCVASLDGMVSHGFCPACGLRMLGLDAPRYVALHVVAEACGLSEYTLWTHYQPDHWGAPGDFRMQGSVYQVHLGAVPELEGEVRRAGLEREAALINDWWKGEVWQALLAVQSAAAPQSPSAPAQPAAQSQPAAASEPWYRKEQYA